MKYLIIMLVFIFSCQKSDVQEKKALKKARNKGLIDSEEINFLKQFPPIKASYLRIYNASNNAHVRVKYRILRASQFQSKLEAARIDSLNKREWTRLSLDFMNTDSFLYYLQIKIPKNSNFHVGVSPSDNMSIETAYSRVISQNTRKGNKRLLIIPFRQMHKIEPFNEQKTKDPGTHPTSGGGDGGMPFSKDSMRQVPDFKKIQAKDWKVHVLE